jgi:hypothetical protein
MTANEKTKAKYFLLLVALACGVYLFFNLRDNVLSKKNEFDNVDKENDKLIPLFNAAVSKEVAMYKSGWYSGCLKSSYLQVENLFTTLKEVSTYTRYGLASSQTHNGILVKVEYTDGRKVEDLYTDITWNGNSRIGNPILLKFVFENGKLTKAFSNGIEKEGSPAETKGPIDHIINAVIHQDYDDNKASYFPPDKTSSDFKKEWDKVK